MITTNEHEKFVELSNGQVAIQGHNDKEILALMGILDTSTTCTQIEAVRVDNANIDYIFNDSGSEAFRIRRTLLHDNEFNLQKTVVGTYMLTEAGDTLVTEAGEKLLL